MILLNGYSSLSRDCSKSFWRLYCSAMLCISAAYAVMRCLCICVSVTFKTNKHINIFHRWVDFHSSFSTQLTQLKSVQPISAKQVSRVFVYFFLSRVTVSVLSIVELRELCYLILISSLQNSIVKLVKTRHIKKL